MLIPNLNTCGRVHQRINGFYTSRSCFDAFRKQKIFGKFLILCRLCNCVNAVVNLQKSALCGYTKCFGQSTNSKSAIYAYYTCPNSPNFLLGEQQWGC